jgi:hypothetical protein
MNQKHFVEMEFAKVKVMIMELKKIFGIVVKIVQDLILMNLYGLFQNTVLMGIIQPSVFFKHYFQRFQERR